MTKPKGPTRHFDTQPNNLTEKQESYVSLMWERGFLEGSIATWLTLDYYDVRDFIIVKYNREKGTDEQDS